MIHKVNDVELLYDSSKILYEKIIKQQADDIINNLKKSVEILKNNWKGIDAGVQINSIISVHNNIVKIRNYLAKLAYDSSIVAANYREIQRISRPTLQSFLKINIDELPPIDEYQDYRDMIDINKEVMEAKIILENTNRVYDDFKNNVYVKYNEIIDNWCLGPGRDNANNAFNEFISQSNTNKQILSEVSISIEKALGNYNL